MVGHNCQLLAQKFGRDRQGNQRYYCAYGYKTFSEPPEKLLDPMYLRSDRALLCLHLLVEGNSIASATRVSGVDKGTILSLLQVAGQRCLRRMDERIKAVKVKYVEADEIWGFVQKKERRKKTEEAGNPYIGDAYTFVGIEATTKLILCFELGRRDETTALAFMEKLRKATDGRFQFTTDGLRAYIDAVETVFGIDIDYGQLVKSYVSDTAGPAEWRYSPGDFISAVKTVIMGSPNKKSICTSYVERQNLTMRMAMRRLTRLTNAFSKKWENLKLALARHFAYYNFCRVHQTIRCTPAMDAGIADHIWSLGELLANGPNTLSTHYRWERKR